MTRVGVRVAGRGSVLTPHEARLCAQALIAENAIAGCAGVAADLLATAERAERAGPAPADPNPSLQTAPPVQTRMNRRGLLVGAALSATVWALLALGIAAISAIA